MTERRARVLDRWPGPGGPVEDSIIALTELVREAAARLDESDPQLARDLRVRASKHALSGVEALLELTR